MCEFFGLNNGNWTEMHGIENVPSAKLPLFNWTQCLTYCTQTTDKRNLSAFQYADKEVINSIFGPYLKWKWKDSAQKIINPFFGISECLKYTEVTASISNASAMYSLSRVNLTGDFLWRTANCGRGSWMLKFLDHTQSDTHTQSAGLLCTSDQSVAQAANYTTHKKHSRPITMPSEGFEPATPAIKRMHNYNFHRTVTGYRRI